MWSPVLGLFDEIVDATHTRILKPGPQAYRLEVESLGVSADKVVYVSDQQSSVDGAKACGGSVIHLDITDPQSGFGSAQQVLELSR